VVAIDEAQAIGEGEPMATGTKRRVQRDWAALLVAHAESGDDVRTFCRREGIGPNLFYRWRTRLRAQRTGKASPLFVPLRPVAVGGSGASGVTVVTARGWRIELAPGFDVATLERALACAQSQLACSG
jgi:transposase-like protein